LNQRQENPALNQAGERPDALQPWQLFTLAGLIGATIVVFMSRGQTPAGIILLSLIIFAAAFVGLAALRTFLPFAEKLLEGGPEVLGGRTRSVLEREKSLLLRFIKELEFDRRMGKVSEKDFAEMSARLRARAARVMRQLDAGSLYRDQIEREVAMRLSGLATADPGLGTRDSGSGRLEPVAGDAVEPEVAAVESRAPNPVSRPFACPSCNADNDPDARFCKHCGTRLGNAS
jgi:hypothetical protein